MKYAAVSTDRGEERSYATTIHSDGKVRKQPLYQGGETNAKYLYENIEDLKVHGIPVVEHVWDRGAIVMPYINQPTLSNYLKIIMEKNPEQFMTVIERLYAYILDS